MWPPNFLEIGSNPNPECGIFEHRFLPRRRWGGWWVPLRGFPTHPCAFFCPSLPLSDFGLLPKKLMSREIFLWKQLGECSARPLKAVCPVVSFAIEKSFVFFSGDGTNHGPRVAKSG